MATDKITEIVDQSAFDQVVKLKTELKDLAGVFADLLKQTKPLTDGLNGVGKGGAGGVGATNKALNEMDKMLKQLATTREKIAESDSQVKLALEQEKIALQNVNKEIRDNIKFEKAQEGSIDQMRAKLSLLHKEYDALGKSARDAMGKDMLTNIQKLDTELKKIEGSTGRYQRNVGNYTNATFQLSQVIRELPAFTYSATTGILAMSNNLPMLADGFMQVAKSTKQVKNDLGELVNDPKGGVNGVTGAIKIFGASIFSMGNIFSIAVALFTLFNKQILDLFKGTSKTLLATKEFSKALEDSSKSIGSEIVALDKLYKTATSTNIAYDERKKAVDRLQELYPAYFKNIEDEIILAGEAKKAYDELTQALVNKAIVGAFDEQASELASKLPALYKELDRLNKLKQQALSSAPPTTSSFSSGVPMSVQTAANSPLAGIDAGIVKTIKDIDALKAAMDQLYKLASDFSGGVAVGGSSASGGRSSSRGGSSTENNRVADLAKQLKEAKDVQDAAYKSGEIAFYEYNSKLLYIASDFAVKLDAIQPSLSKKESEGVAQLKEDIVDTANLGKEGLQKILDEYKKESEEIVKQSNKNIKDLAKQQQAMAVSFPAVQLKKTLKEIIADISEVLQVAASVFGILGDWGTQVAGIIADKANSEAEQQIKNIDRVEKAQLLSLSRITMGTKEYEEAKRRIEVQAEARRQETEKKRITAIRNAAKIQKAADVASIISSTAAAIVGMLKNPGGVPGIALSVAAGITGGLQLTRALSAPLPGYEDGTDYHPTNEPFLAGEAGAEGVILPNGKRMLVDRPTIFPAGLKGTKVINNKDLMQSVYNSAIVKLATQGTVTTDKMQEALIQSLEEQAGKIDNVVKAVENLKLSVKFENFSEHINHVKQRTR